LPIFALDSPQSNGYVGYRISHLHHHHHHQQQQQQCVPIKGKGKGKRGFV